MPRLLKIIWIICKILGAILTICGFLGTSYVLFRVPTTNKMLSELDGIGVMIDEVHHQLEDGLRLMREEFGERIEKKRFELNKKTRHLKGRNDAFEKFMDGLKTKSFLEKREFGDFFEYFMRSRENNDSGSSKITLDWDEILAYARQIVQEKIQRHAFDGLGMVDYALASAGGKILRHSETYGSDYSGSWWVPLYTVSADAEKMIRVSFGEHGQCFRLKGESGFVDIKLWAAIVPKAVTLEHVAKDVAYDRLNAPKRCRVYGWMQGQDSSESKNKFILTKFSYDLEKSNAQTFMVKEPAVSVDTIRFEFESNHGRASHTCIYRLRVHGHQLNALSLIN